MVRFWIDGMRDLVFLLLEEKNLVSGLARGKNDSLPSLVN